jgi:hypothetical protein
VLPRLSELGDWLARGFRVMSGAHWVASVLGGGALVAAVVNPLLDWMGPLGFVVFVVCVSGLLAMLLRLVG